MGRLPWGRPLLAVLIAATSLCTIATADAQQRPRYAIAASHDGVYAVDISTQQGGCDRVYHWTIIVSAGQVRSAADGFMQASGVITPRGGVSLAFRRDSQVANVAGQVRDKAGWGTWSSSTLQCSGTWGAVRQNSPSPDSNRGRAKPLALTRKKWRGYRATRPRWAAEHRASSSRRRCPLADYLFDKACCPTSWNSRWQPRGDLPSLTLRDAARGFNRHHGLGSPSIALFGSCFAVWSQRS